MGRDKALLAYPEGDTLVQTVAFEVANAAASVALLGDPARYSHLGIPVIPDLIPACGPMSGLHAALHSTAAEWIVLVACDLPNVKAAFLRRLIDLANLPLRCVAAQSGGGGLEPLCAVYHRNTLLEVEFALRQGHLRMRDLLTQLGAIGMEADARLVRNVNTTEDWKLHLTEKERLP